jgi:CubicO group peptidase (beta-lactamase class C family)
MKKVLHAFVLVFFILLLSTNAYSQNSFERDVEQYSKSISLPELAVGVVKDGNLIFFKALGKADSARMEPITADHIFGIASLTKSFASVLFQKLEAEGKLSLADPIDKFPNKYFTKERWNTNTTLGHILSQTSESEPIGTGFAYNGSKYNLVYNALSSIYNLPDNDGVYRNFTQPIEEKILRPLQMSHTLVRYNEQEFGSLKKWIVCPQYWDIKDSTWKSRPIRLKNIQSGPGFGMMSSMNDLVKYSDALDQNTLIAQEQYRKITTPFYIGSPYGMGWFVTDFEGVKMNWAYGYGDYDASILLKIPSERLSLIVLSTSSLLSQSTRLGFGNPLNSPIICSFLRNFVNKKSTTFYRRLAIEESFSQAIVQLFAPSGLVSQKENMAEKLALLLKKHPKASIWQTPTFFELAAKTQHKEIMNFALEQYQLIKNRPSLHPALQYYAGEIAGKVNNQTLQIELFTKLAAGESFKEQGYKLNAMFWLGNYYLSKNEIENGKELLQRFLKYKEHFSNIDAQYKETKKLLDDL